MRRLLQFIYNYRAFFVFLVFEGFSGFLIVQNQKYHRAAFLNSSNTLVGSINHSIMDVTDYFSLKDQNAVLSEQIARLNEKVVLLENRLETQQVIAGNTEMLYDFVPAKVVNNSYRQLNNYITINKGRNDSINADMGVIGPDGIVGKVRSVSSRFATLVSLLHTDYLVSSKLKRSEHLCTTTWDGRDPQYCDILYVPKHVFVTKGDTVITSGYNSVFPEGQLIGVVEDIRTQPNATFHDIRIKLTTDFSRLTYVSVIKYKMAAEKDSLEINTEIIN